MNFKIFKISTLSLLSFFIASSICSGQAKIKFDVEGHDFGMVQEGDIATHEFFFTNIGDEPLVVANVKPSCGCTTPSWTNTPVMPGKKGSVKASYNSNGRPGAFNKSITVSSNGSTPTVNLYIKGVVNKKPEAGALSNADEATAPVMRLSRTDYDFGKAEKGQRLSAKVNVINTGKTPLKISDLVAGCRCVAFKSYPDEFAPGQSGYIEIFYTPQTLGSVTDYAMLLSNDVKFPQVKLTLKAQVVDNLAPASVIKENIKPIPFH